MAVKVSDLTTESTPASTDILIIADPSTGLAKKITVSALKTYMDGLGGGGDTTAPVIITATAATASTITIVFSESVTVTTAGWSFKKNGASWAISSVSGSGSTWSFTMSTSGLSTDTLLMSYSSTTGTTLDTAANELVTFTDQAVTNSIPASVSYQTESETFFAANTGLNTTQKDALDGLVVALKAIGWSKFLAVYPYIGGTSSAHKWNLVNPVDSDGAFRLTFSGSFTHASTGVTPAGTSTYQNTHMIPSTSMTDGDVHMSVYLRSNVGSTTTGYEWGVIEGGTANWYFNPRRVDDTAQAFGFHAVQDQINGSVTDSRGLWTLSNRVSELRLYKNATELSNDTSLTAGTEASATNIYLSNYNYTPGEGSTREMAFASIGTGLTAAEVDDLYTAVQAYQTSLSRNV
jgi:hypothetical protein